MSSLPKLGRCVTHTSTPSVVSSPAETSGTPPSQERSAVKPESSASHPGSFKKGSSALLADFEALQQAADEGKVETLKTLLRRNLGLINMRDKGGLTLLHRAAIKGQTDIVELLLKEGANLEIQTNRGRTALQTAAKHGHVDVARLLLEKGADPERTNHGGMTALHTAVNYSYIDIIKLLLEKGATLDTQNKEGRTALHMGVQNSDIEVVNLLLEKGANTETADTTYYKMTPLHNASNANNAEIAAAFVAKGGKTNLVNAFNKTPLHIAALYGYNECVSELLKAGDVDMEATDDDGMTALHHAANLSKAECVRILVEKGAKTTAKDLEGKTPFDYVARRFNAPACALLLDGADLNATDGNGRTLLHQAAIQGKTAMVQLLLDNGADITQPDSSGQMALHHAVQKGHGDIIDLLAGKTDLVQKDAQGQTVLHLAVAGGDDATVKVLLKHGAPIDAIDDRGNTARDVAVAYANIGVINILDANGARFDKEEALLHRIVPNASLAQLVEWHEKGIMNFAQVDGLGRTVLHQAAARGHAAFVDTLVEIGLDIDAVDNENNTPLQIAAAKGQLEAFRALLKKKEETLTSPEGNRLLHFAADRGYDHIVDALAKEIYPDEVKRKAALATLKKTDKTKAAWSTLSTRAGVYTDQLSGETRAILLVPVEKEDNLYAHVGSRAAIAYTSRRGDSETSSTAGWFARPLIREGGINYGDFDDGGNGILNFYERLDVPVKKLPFLGTGRTLPAQEFQVCFVAPDGTQPLPIDAYSMGFDENNKLVSTARMFAVDEKPCIVSRVKAKDTGPFRVDEVNDVLAKSDWFIPDDTDISHLIVTGHGVICPENPMIQMSSIPEGMIIDYYGEPGKILEGNVAWDLRHKQPYASLKRENGDLYAKLSPEAKKKKDFAEVFGVPPGFAPNLQISKSSATAQGVASTSMGIIPELVVGGDNDVLALSCLAFEKKAAIATSGRHQTSTLADHIDSASRCGITRVGVHACMEEEGGEGAKAISSMKNKAQEDWQEVSSDGMSLPVVIPDDSYNDAEVTVMSFSFSEEHLPDDDILQKHLYKTSNNPTEDNEDNDEWERVLPDGTFETTMGKKEAVVK
jgi:ankyrin repeat protein